MKKIILAGSIAAFFFLVFSFFIQDNELIWIQTRIFGLIAFLALFTTILLGELRLLSKEKGNFTLFRFHIPIAIFSTFLILIHFISAVFDKYKWGIGVSFYNYLGFSFSNNWLLYLSLGTLAFYLIIIVALTSMSKSIQFLGFKKWKIIHYLSYLSFVGVYIHSINLGTDVKTSFLAPIIKPLIIGMFLSVTALIIVRMLNSKPIFADQTEINLAAVFFIIMLFGSTILASTFISNNQHIKELTNRVSISEKEYMTQKAMVDSLNNEIQRLQVINNGTVV